jgi:hypothetical protein
MHGAAHTVPIVSAGWEVLTKYLRLAFPASSFYRYSCPRCFRNLWSNLDGKNEPPCPVHGSIAEPRFDETDGPFPDAVIVFDGPPPEETRSQSLPNLHFESLFSPAVLYTLLAEKSGHNRRTWLLVDPHRRLDSTAIAVANIFAPNVRVWDDPSLELPLPFHPAIVDDNRKIKAAREHLKLLVREPTTRHDLSNVVGPVLLGFRPEDGRAEWIVERLRELLECTGAKREMPPPAANLTQWTRDNGSIEFMLIDDQHCNGWGQVLCNMLGVRPVSPTRQGQLTTIGSGFGGNVAVSVSETAESIISELERRGPSDRRFNLRFGSNAAHQVLLLDLRLFAGKTLQQEAEFFSRIARIARERFCDRMDLPWPGFGGEELDRLESWLKSAAKGDRADRCDSVYLEALALLPRVLALSDLSLPILIFSSTTQRKVTDRLQDYRNIVLEFSKPALLGYDTLDLVAQTSASFQAAIERALRLCKARALCRNVLRLADQADQFTTNRRSHTSIAHYELYIDESGSSVLEGDLDAVPPDDRGPFIVGGLLVEYSEALGPEELHKKMEHQNPPLRWWPRPSIPGDAFLAKSTKDLAELPIGAIQLSDDDIVEKFLQIASRDAVIGVCLEHRDDGSRQPEDEVEALTEADNRYRRMLSYLIEAVLFDLLPEVVVNKNATLSIFVATRVRKAKDFKGGEALLARLMERFGFDGNLNVPEPYVQTIDEPFVVSILSEIKKRRDDNLVVHAEHTRGVVLHYPKKGGRQSPKWPKTRHQHYLADIVARCAFRSRSDLQRRWRALFDRGSYNVLDDRFVALIKSARAISRGELSGAVLELQKFDFGAPIPKTSSSWIVLKRVRRSLLKVFSGADFITTSVEIGRQHDSAQPAAEGDIGSVKFYDVDGQFGYIRTEDRDCRFVWGDWGSATPPRRGESVRFLRKSRPDLSADRVHWVHSLT